MKSDPKDTNKGTMRMELKYCEHCGGLWVREGGAGVYCEKCQPKVADLPKPKKRPGKIKLAIGSRPAVETYEREDPDENTWDFEAVGGVA
jgi:hypothetical protein